MPPTRLGEINLRTYDPTKRKTKKKKRPTPGRTKGQKNRLDDVMGKISSSRRRK